MIMREYRHCTMFANLSLLPPTIAIPDGQIPVHGKELTILLRHRAHVSLVSSHESTQSL